MIRYWDVPIKPEEYSYVNSALLQGYSILTYDRLGTGNSSKPDAYDVVQAGVEIEILRALTELARAGELLYSSSSSSSSSSPNATLFSGYTPRKVVHVGHSYGSFMTGGLLSRHGGASDGAILTGLLVNRHLLSGPASVASFGLEFAAESDPARFGGLGSGYITSRTLSDVQQVFFKKGSFEPELLRHAELVKQPNAVAEFLSSAEAFTQPAVDFKGPIQLRDSCKRTSTASCTSLTVLVSFFNGEYDFPVCGGDCNGVYDMANTTALFHAASDISVYLQPGTGHGLTMSTNATAGYKVMFSYLD